MKSQIFSQIFLAFSALAISNFCISAEKPSRIISAGPSVTELLIALEATPNIVGVDLSSQSVSGVGSVPILGYHRQLAAEGVLSLSPTHIIGSKDMGPPATLKLLDHAGVHVNVIPTGNTLEDFNQRIDVIAQITDKSSQAKVIKKHVRETIETLEKNKPKQSPKVMFLMSSKGRPITVAGNDTTVNTIISMAGGENPAASQTNSYKQFSTEAIVDMQPDVLLISQRSLKQIGSIEDFLKQHPLLALTPAVKNKQIIPVKGQAIIGGFGLASLEFTTALNQRFQSVQ